jgi:polysaccharide transporter, PST family
MQKFLNAVQNLKRERVDVWFQAHPGLKTILVNIGWLSFDKVIRMGVGLVMGAWIARYLGALQFGHLNYALAVITLFSVPSLLGLQHIVVRDLVQAPYCKHDLLGTSFVLKFFAAAGMYVMLAGYAVVAADTPISRTLLIMVGALILNNPFSTLALWFQSQVQSQYVVWANNLAFLLVTGLRIALIVMQRPS